MIYNELCIIDHNMMYGGLLDSKRNLFMDIQFFLSKSKMFENIRLHIIYKR